MSTFRMLLCLVALTLGFDVSDTYSAPPIGRHALSHCKGCPIARATCHHEQLACAVWDGSEESRGSAEAKACGDAIGAMHKSCDSSFAVPQGVDCKLCGAEPGPYSVTEQEGRICCRHTSLNYYYSGKYGAVPGGLTLPTDF